MLLPGADREMGMNLLKEFGALLWHHPLIACCFLVLFTPPFFPVLQFFSPLLISTALFMVAIITIGPDLRWTSVGDGDDDDDDDEGEEVQLIGDSQVEVLEDKKALVQLNRLQEHGHHHDDTWLVTKTVVAGKESGKSKWRRLRRIYEEKGIDWIENLFRNDDWMGPAGLNVSILQGGFPQRDEDEAESLETTRSIEKSGDGGGGTPNLPQVLLLLSDREFPNEFAPLGGGSSRGDDFPSAEEKQLVFAADAPASLLDQDASTHTLAITNFDMPALETGDEEEEDEQYGEGYESGDGYEEGHSDLGTGSPIPGDLQEEKKSDLTVSEIGGDQHEEMSPISSSVITKTDEETKIVHERLEQLHDTAAAEDSFRGTQIHGDPSLLKEEVQSFVSVESHDSKPVAPRTETLQEGPNSLLSVEVVPSSSTATHNCEEKLVLAIESKEETGPHGATISSQLHLPVAETMSIPATDNDNHHIQPSAADSVDETVDDDNSAFSPSIVTCLFNNAADEGSHTIKIPEAEAPHDRTISFSDAIEQAVAGDAMVNSLVQTFRIASHEPKLIELPA
jgi:hypothetical protein